MTQWMPRCLSDLELVHQLASATRPTKLASSTLHSDAGELILSLRHPQHLTNRILSAGRHIELDFSAPEPPLGHELDAFTTRVGPISAVSFDAGFIPAAAAAEDAAAGAPRSADPGSCLLD